MLLLKILSFTEKTYLIFLIFHLSALVLVSSQTTGDVRLTGYGSNALGGLLEVYLDGSWGTVCGNTKFGLLTASVACRQLGLGPAVDVVYYPDLRFGISDNDVAIGDVVCTGQESHLLRCHYKTADTLTPNCLPYHNIGIMCSASVLPYSGSVRIVPTPTSIAGSDGLLQLYLSGEWLNVCYKGFTLEAASSACKQMGYTSAKKYSLSSFDTPLSYSWELDTVECNSQDSCLSSCVSAVKSNTCSQGIQLQCGFDPSQTTAAPSGNKSLCEEDTPYDGDVRMVSTSADGLKGVPEVYTSKQWVKICIDGFDLLAGDVVCKQLGHVAAVRFVAENGEGNGVQFSCSGIESSTQDCMMTVQTQCSKFVDLRCISGIPPYGSLRLFNGSGSAGSLHLFNGSLYIPLCDHSFSNNELAVACRQLGYETGVQVINNTLFGLSKFTTVPYDHTFHCSGNEAHLLECDSVKLTTSDIQSVCRDPYDAVSIQCSSSSSGKSRLVTGNSSSGVLQVQLDGQWGTVCGLGFSHYEAHVACREMGFATSSGFELTGQLTSDQSPIHFTSFQCSGFESDLLSCPHRVADNGTCQHDHDVYLHCSNSYPIQDGSIRLVGDSHRPYIGRLEIMYHGLWMSVCGKLFQQETADVACRQVGYTHAESYCTDACEGSGGGQIFFGELECQGGELELIECETDVHNKHLCGHENDVGITCSSIPLVEPDNSTPSPSPSSTIRSVTEPTAGVVEPTHSSLLPFSDTVLYSILGGIVLILVVTVVLCAVVCCTCVYRKKKQRRFRGGLNSGRERQGAGVDEPDMASPRATNMTFLRESPLQSSDDASMADLKERDSPHKDKVELGSFGIDMHSDITIELRDLNANTEGATVGHARKSSVSFEEVDFAVEAPPRYDEIDFKSSSVFGSELLSPSGGCSSSSHQATADCYSLDEEIEKKELRDLKFSTISVEEL